MREDGDPEIAESTLVSWHGQAGSSSKHSGMGRWQVWKKRCREGIKPKKPREFKGNWLLCAWEFLPGRSTRMAGSEEHLPWALHQRGHNCPRKKDFKCTGNSQLLVAAKPGGTTAQRVAHLCPLCGFSPAQPVLAGGLSSSPEGLRKPLPLLVSKPEVAFTVSAVRQTCGYERYAVSCLKLLEGGATQTSENGILFIRRSNAPGTTVGPVCSAPPQ